MRFVLMGLGVSVLVLPSSGSAMTPSPPPPTLQLIRVSIDGKRAVVLARDASLLGGSPDGRTMSFKTSEGVWVTTGLPQSNRLLITDLGDVRARVDVSWSGDGRLLAAACDCEGPVFVFDVQTGTKRTLPFAAHSPSLSPDGRRIAVATASGASVIATLSGRIVVRLGPVEQVRFAPRGRMLAYVNERGLVCVMRDDGRHRRCLAPGTRPVWSPRATKLAFQVSPNFGFDWRFVVAHVTGSPRVQSVSPWFHFPQDAARTDRNGGLSWSPNGRRVAYGNADLHIVPGRTVPNFGGAFCGVSSTAFTLGDEVVYTSECPHLPGLGARDVATEPPIPETASP